MELLALVAFDEGRVDDHRQAGAQHRLGKLMQPGVGRCEGARAVDAATDRRLAVGGCRQAVQPLAFPVGAKVDSAESLRQLRGKSALAGTGQAVGNDQGRTRRLRVLFGEVEIAMEQPLVCAALGRIEIVLGQAQTDNLGADHGPVALVEIEQLKAAVIAGGLQVAVEKQPAQVGLATVIQVHGQKGDVVDDVDPAQILVELDAVEQQRPGIRPGHVGEVDVAGAAAHKAALLALPDHRREGLAGGAGPFFQPGQLGCTGAPLHQRPKLREILQDRRNHRIRTTVGRVRCRRFRISMQRRNPFGEGDQVPGVQPAGGQDPIELAVGGETAHLDRILERRVAIDDRRVGAATDLCYGQIKFFCELTVQAQLFPAVVMAPGQSREVEKSQIEGFLDLVGIVPGKENPRDMGLDQHHCIDRVIIELRRAHRPYNPGLLLSVHDPAPGTYDQACYYCSAVCADCSARGRCARMQLPRPGDFQRPIW